MGRKDRGGISLDVTTQKSVKAISRAVAAGVYPYRLQVAGQVLTRKMVVLR